MMTQNDLVVVGIDVAKDKVDSCIRRFELRQTFPNNPQGRRKLIAWLRKYKVGKAVMEASGGYEREWRTGHCTSVVRATADDIAGSEYFAF
jgi:transposase